MGGPGLRTKITDLNLVSAKSGTLGCKYWLCVGVNCCHQLCSSLLTSGASKDLQMCLVAHRKDIQTSTLHLLWVQLKSNGKLETFRRIDI